MGKNKGGMNLLPARSLSDIVERWPALGNCFLSTDANEHLEWWFRFLEPYLPEVRLKGEQVFPPKLEKPGDTVIILCNHLSDLDHFLIMAKANRWLENKVPVRLTGFTQTRFNTYPVIGSLAKKWVIGVEKGSKPQEILDQVNQFIDRGFNTFLLFPEGKIFCHSSYTEGIEWQRDNSKLPNMLHHVLYPRFGAYEALVGALKDRLKYIVDITLDYPHHPLTEHEWNHHLYPSIFFSMWNDTPPVTMHVRNIKVSNWKDALERKTLLNLWYSKDLLLRKRLRPVWHYKKSDKEKSWQKSDTTP